MTSASQLRHLDIVDKANEVLTALESGEKNATEIAETISEPISTTYRLIRSLLQMDWVMHGSSRGLYRLGFQTLAAGSAFTDSLDVRGLLSPLLLRIRDATLLTSYLCLLSDSRAVCIERHAGHGVRLLALTVGGSMPLLSGAGPVAMLAAMPRKERVKIVAREGVSGEVRQHLEEQFADYEANGYVICDGEVTRGVASVGAPVFDHSGRVVAAVSAGGLRDQVIKSGTLADLIVETAWRGSELLGWKASHG